MESIRRIIVPTDFSDLSEVAIQTAIDLGRGNAASIHLLHVVRLPFLHTNYDVNVPEAIWEGIRKGTRERMDDACKRLEEAGVADVGRIVSESRQPAEAIAHSVADIDADIVVMATHGRQGLRHAFVGSVTARTLRICPVPVLAVKKTPLELGSVRRILVPTDFSPPSSRAARLACSLAERIGAEIDLLHVLDEWPAYLQYMSAEALDFETRGRAIIGDRLESLATEMGRSGVLVSSRLSKGVTTDVVVEEAELLGSDLIVMGTHGYRGMTHLALGSVTERTLRLSPCPVLTTRGDQQDPNPTT